MKGNSDDVVAGQLKTPRDDRPSGSRGRRDAKPLADEGHADVGKALRNAFQATVEEKVPDELLDLLRRLD